MQEHKFHPYRMTTTITFHDCANRAAIISPARYDEMERIAKTFQRRLGKHFKITRHEKSRRPSVTYHRFYKAGKKWGYTMGATLIASDASVHTYPEWRYGGTYELELNLCYLTKKARRQHHIGIKGVVVEFKRWLQPNDVEVENSRARYFRPVKRRRETKSPTVRNVKRAA